MGFSWFLVLLSHLTYKAGLIIGATRLICYWLLRHIVINRGHHLFYMTRHYCNSSNISSSHESHDDPHSSDVADDEYRCVHQDEVAVGPHPSCSSFPEIDDDIDDQIMKMNQEYYSQLDDDGDFDVTNIYEDLNNAVGGELHDQVEGCETCAVCLNELRNCEQVRELRNCCHVFHRDCINRWLDHDDQKTCPLCRTPLLMPRSRSSINCLGTSSTMTSTSKPSWAVERLLYLFGDDLL